eukprot:1688007-Pyramimonas_sp.AAC.1
MATSPQTRWFCGPSAPAPEVDRLTAILQNAFGAPVDHPPPEHSGESERAQTSQSAEFDIARQLLHPPLFIRLQRRHYGGSWWRSAD